MLANANKTSSEQFPRVSQSILPATLLVLITSWLGKRSFATRVKRLGIERIREIARENGKKGGRPPKEKVEVSDERL